MSIEMLLATSDKAIAKDILGGYERTHGVGWSTIALSTGRDWSSRENGGFLAWFINKLDLGVKRKVGGLTLIGRDDATEARAIQHMDEYVADESGENGTIAYWSKAPHIHAWFDDLYRKKTGKSINGYIVVKADVLHKLRDDCDEVLRVDRERGRDAAYAEMGRVFPLTGEDYELFSAHEYSQKHIDDLEQTKILLDYLFALKGAEEAHYAYDPSW